MKNVQSPAPASHSRPFKVLLAEDEPATHNYVARLLEGAGYQVDDAADGIEAWRLFRADRPDLVITDLGMPYVGGVEFCRLVKQVSEVPVLIISGRDPGELQSVSLRAGADAWLTKPFDPKRLVFEVHRLLADQTVLQKEPKGREQ